MAVLALAAPGAAAFSLGCEEGPLFRACEGVEGDLPERIGEDPPPVPGVSGLPQAPPGVPGIPEPPTGLPGPAELPEPPAPPAPPEMPEVPAIPTPGACDAAPRQLPLGLGNVDALQTVADPHDFCVDLLA